MVFIKQNINIKKKYKQAGKSKGAKGGKGGKGGKVG